MQSDYYSPVSALPFRFSINEGGGGVISSRPPNLSISLKSSPPVALRAPASVKRQQKQQLASGQCRSD